MMKSGNCPLATVHWQLPTAYSLMFTVYFSLLVLLAGCGKAPEEAGERSVSKLLSVYVVNYPLQYFAERIGGEVVDVQFPAPADEDPAYWSPSPEIVGAYQQADLILMNGATYAKWASKVSLPASKQVDTSHAFAARLIEMKAEAAHIHGPEGKHAHGGYAFTTWLDLTLAIEQAEAVKNALANAVPADEAIFADNLAVLKKDLLEVDAQIADVLSVDPQRPLIFSHPVYQYFQQRYKLNGKSVHWEPDEPPTGDMLAKLKALLTDHPATLMIWEEEPAPETVTILEALGIRSVVFNPCGNVPDSGDFLFAMRRGVANLKLSPESQ
jgi:zinc transport system substrate-binding protein